MHFVKTLTALPLLSLTACGGSGTNPNVVNLQQQFLDLEVAAGLPLNQISSVQESGVTLSNVGQATAQFDGFILAPVERLTNESAIGKLSLNAKGHA